MKTLEGPISLPGVGAPESISQLSQPGVPRVEASLVPERPRKSTQTRQSSRIAAGCVDTDPIETGTGGKTAATAVGRTRCERVRKEDGNI